MCVAERRGITFRTIGTECMKPIDVEHAEIALEDVVHWLGFDFSTDDYFISLEAEREAIFLRAKY